MFTGSILEKSYHVRTGLCSWWRHKNGNIFGVTGLLCGEFIGYRWIPARRPGTRRFDVFFDLCLNQQLSKQWRRRCSLWRHCTVDFCSNDEVQRQFEKPNPRRRRRGRQRPQKSRDRDTGAHRVIGGAMLLLLFLTMVAIVIYFVYSGRKWWRHDTKRKITHYWLYVRGVPWSPVGFLYKRPGRGLLSHFTPIRYFPFFSAPWRTHLLSNITPIFDKCRRSSAALTPGKYEYDLKNLTGTFARLKILLVEKLTNVVQSFGIYLHC